jgi:hypothetical protein
MRSLDAERQSAFLLAHPDFGSVSSSTTRPGAKNVL